LADVRARGWLAAAPSGWRSPPWRADAVHVVASELRREGAPHAVVERCELGGA
jgi:hypothetical protein